MSTPIAEVLEIPTPKQFIRSVRRWMKQNKVGPRKLARLAKTSPATLYKIEKNPDTIKSATIGKYLRAMRTYKPDAASRPSNNPARSASRRD